MSAGDLSIYGEWLVQESNGCTCCGLSPHEPGCGYEPLVKLKEIAAALRAAGYAVVHVPDIAYKGPHDTNGSMLLTAADKAESARYPVGGSNVGAAVAQVLREVAAAADAAEQMKDLDSAPLRVRDFPRQYRWSMVRAYSVISGVPDVFEATQEGIDAGFQRCLECSNLRRTHELYLESRGTPVDASQQEAK